MHQISVIDTIWLFDKVIHPEKPVLLRTYIITLLGFVLMQVSLTSERALKLDMLVKIYWLLLPLVVR